MAVFEFTNLSLPRIGEGDGLRMPRISKETEFIITGPIEFLCDHSA